MFGFIKKIKAIKHWLKAMEYASSKHYEDAYLHLTIAKSGGIRHIEAVLFNAFLAIATNRYIEANNCLDNFFSRIFEATKYNDDEKNYLAAYAAWCCNSLPEGSSSRQYLKSIYFDRYSLDKVSRSIKNNFPLRVDPFFED